LTDSSTGTTVAEFKILTLMNDKRYLTLPVGPSQCR